MNYLNLAQTKQLMSLIRFKHILAQLKADLIGKDSHRGITLTYAWLANQFGHVSLGFIPTFLIYSFFKFEEPIRASLYVSLFWFLFELYNFLGPLLMKKVSYAKNVYIPNKNKYVFQPSWKNIAFDTFTDVCFFILGAFLFSFLFRQDLWLIILLVALTLYLMLASNYWFLTKMYQHNANYPFQFRLSQWDYKIEEEDKLKVDNFLTNNSNGNHLLIFGSQLRGKTALGIGILNELSIKHKACLYSSAIKLYAYFFVEHDLKKEKIWNWKNAEYLIIDDVNPGNPIKEDLISPEGFLKFLDPTSVGKMNKESSEILAKKNIIWILGNYKNSDIKENKWVQMLSYIGVEQNKISVINLP